MERRTQIMGMSASQARLLSITARLTNNEFRSQTITNSKLRLATESEEASRAYMDALEQKQLQFMYYDNNGNMQRVPLTPAFISAYAPMKNQYMLENPAGKLLVTNVDAENFEKTETLDEFLACYGLVDDISAQQVYKEAYNKYMEDMETYNIEMRRYQVALGREDLYEIFSSKVGCTTDSNNPPQGCYAEALEHGGGGCYLHVLNHLLDWDGTADSSVDDPNHYYRTWDSSYWTSASTLFTPKPATDYDDTTNFDYEDGHHYSMGWMSSPSSGLLTEFKAISDALTEGYEIDGETYMYYCDGNEIQDITLEDYPDVVLPGLEALKAEADTLPNDDPDKAKLNQIYYLCGDYDQAGNLKTLKQKVIDLYYFIQNWGAGEDSQYYKSVLKRHGYMTDDDSSDNPHRDDFVNAFMRQTLINFTEGDMRKLSVKLPEKPTPPALPLYSVIVNDKEKAQWYTNLWFKMNGSDTANLVKQIEGAESGKIEFSIENLFERVKDVHKANYELFDDNLYTNSEWLEFALEHGIVTMIQARYYNPADDSGKIMNSSFEGIYWQSIIHTEASDIISVDDEKAIAIAEVKYKRRMTEIENKDKKYDQDLKKLDTEHSALQTEYDSIKEVISKNTERSFKAFS